MTSAKAFGLTVVGSSGGEELVLCPFHDDRNSSAWFEPKKELFYCAVCGMGMNGRTLAKRLSISYEEVEERADAEPEDFNFFVEDVKSKLLFDLGIETYHPYFAARGLREEAVKRFGLRFRNSEPMAAVIPIPTMDGTVKGYQLRFVDDRKAGTRYKTIGDVTPVWPMNALRYVSASGHILLFEGVFSAMAMWQHFADIGIFGIVPMALLGAKANEHIANLLRPFDVTFCYDDDKAGYNAMTKMKKINPIWEYRLIRQTPDEMDTNEREEFVRNVMGSATL